MAHYRTKFVTWRGLKKDSVVKAVRIGNSTSYASYVVKDVNMSNVTLLRWGNEEVVYDVEHAMFEIEIPREEFERNYREKANKLVAKLQNQLAVYEIGPHVMDNSWISYDFYEMAARLQENKLNVLGICKDIVPKDPKSSAPADIAICVEDADGEKFWCHASSFHLGLALDMYLNP